MKGVKVLLCSFNAKGSCNNCSAISEGERMWKSEGESIQRGERLQAKDWEICR